MKIWFKRHYYVEKIGDTDHSTFYQMGTDDDVWPFYYSYEKGGEASGLAHSVDFDGGPFLFVGNIFPSLNKKILSINMIQNTVEVEK